MPDQPDQPKRKDLIDRLGDEVMEFLPESKRTPENAYCLGRICGAVVGFSWGRQLANWLFPTEKDKK
jgi:hypothetical protein